MRRQYLFGFSGLLGLTLLCILVMAYEYGFFMTENSELSSRISTEIGYDLAQARVDYVISGRNSMIGGGRIKFTLQGNHGRERDFLIENAFNAPTFKLYRDGYRFTIKTQPGSPPSAEQVVTTLRQVIAKSHTGSRFSKP